jgi:hypothetical protein
VSDVHLKKDGGFCFCAQTIQMRKKRNRPEKHLGIFQILMVSRNGFYQCTENK